MKRKHILTLAVCLLAAAVSACTSDDGNSDSRLGDDDPDGADAGQDNRDILGADDTDLSPGEAKEVCEEQGAECGFVPDDRGGVADCGSCDDGAACGVLEKNRCVELNEAELCNPLSKNDACEGKECGAAGDGCGGTFECGDCEAGEACGIVESFQCGALPSEDQCPAQIQSCEEAGAECGQIGNGCGALIDCDEEVGGCSGDAFCGGDGPNQCGSLECEPLSVAEACANKCGVVSNGCGVEVDGGTIECPSCPGDQTCGGAGRPNRCGEASDGCQPLDAEAACGARECGAASDGCEGSVVCGNCFAGTTCVNGMCEPACAPLTQAEACAGKNCGQVSDGCIGSYNCGNCGVGRVCGLEEPFVCADRPPSMCTPRSEAEACAGKECGLAYDGCGTGPANTYDCALVNGGCSDGEFCGILQPFQCDPPTPVNCTTANSCAELGWECGVAFDECGNMFDCSMEGIGCNLDTETCIGGVGGPTRCDNGLEEPGGGGCDLCSAIPDCSQAAQRTSISGRVITAGRNDGDTPNQVGVPNAFVYILANNDPSQLPAIEAGIPPGATACDRCEDQQLGPVLASAATDALGYYTITGDVPVGAEFVLVVKIGKFRRAVQITLDPAAACQATNIDSMNTRLPRDMSDGLAVNIPRIAVTTGDIDAMECVLYKMGIAESEFGAGQAGGSARVHLYGHDGAGIDGGDSNPDEDELHTDLARMMSYDMLVFDCQGFGFPDHDASDARVREYVNRGGRLFASHLSYTWICDNGFGIDYSPADPFNTGLASSATFPGCAQDTGGGLPNPSTGIVSVGRPGANSSKIQGFADWLVNEGAATLNMGRYEFSIVDPRDLATAVGAASDEYVYLDDNGSISVQQYAFNTPYGAPSAEICGRVAYSGFHVAPAGGSADYNDADFPAHCSDAAANNGELADQEKLLLLALFDLGSCVTEEREPPACTVVDCTGRCGEVPDGCGGVVDCPCQCTQTSCEAESAECGLIPDGCGAQLDCGLCPEGSVCELQTNTCEPLCTPLTLQQLCPGTCGFVSDGCGGVIGCPGCGGALNCVAGSCLPESCEPQACPDNLECGIVSDGCSGVADCGTCTLPEVCGGAGESNMCDVPECRPLDCEDLSAECGWVGDGCGSAVDCGECPVGQVCGALQANQCDGCQPLDCGSQEAECGTIGDGCGGTVECGSCPAGEVCGATEPNKCGDGPGCMPLKCSAVGAECGIIGDGCGDEVDCGPCPEGEICGLNEPFKCALAPKCEPTTCEEAGASCGALSDGCDDRLDCGTCRSGFVCRQNQCERVGAK